MNSILKLYWNLIFNLTGLDVSFDARYHDWSFYFLEFKASYQGVKKLLVEKHFVPREFAPGETRLQVIGCEMKAVQISGPYNEVSFQAPVEPLEDSPGDKFAHLYLPVSTEAARWPGVNIYGFPKFLAQIEFEKDEERIICRLSASNEAILEFSMDDRMGTKKREKWGYYGDRKQQIIRTTFELEGLIWEEAGESASYVLGKHPVAETIQDLLLSDEVVRTVIGHNISGILRKPARIKIE